MEHIYYTLHDFLLNAKTITYIVMGLVIVAAPIYWWFLTEREEPIRKY